MANVEAAPLPTRIKVQLPLKTEAQLRAFILHAWGVVIPNIQVCEQHSTPWRAFADSYFARCTVAIWPGSRQLSGKTFALSTLTATEAVTLKANVNLLGGSGAQSVSVHKAMRQLWSWRRAPRALLLTDPTAMMTKLAWGNEIQALMASQTSVRGGHPERVRLDEIDEMNLDICNAALGQPKGREIEGIGYVPAQATLTSTHQHADGTMTEKLKEAAEKEDWRVHRWCYRETMAQPGGWCTERDLTAVRTMLTAAMFQNEVELGEPSPEGRAIDTEAVERMFQPKLGRFRGAEGERVVIQVASAEHGAGADWARKQDFTVIIVLAAVYEGFLYKDGLPVPTCYVVSYERMQRRPWPNMVARFDANIRAFGDCSAAHDATGLGDVVDGYMESEAEAVNLSGSGQLRRGILNECIRAIENDEIRAPKIETLYNDCKYATNDDLWGSGHLPDGLCALALAYRAITRGGSGGGNY